jgi:tetratricopeptide (TPR) repeat protein
MQFAIVHICPPKGNHYALAEMAETVFLGLKSLGHDCIQLAPADLFEIAAAPPPNDRQFIIFGSNSIPLYENPFPLPRNSVLYNFEQIYPQSPWLRAGYIDYLCQYPVWDYSLANIAKLRQLGIHHAAHVPVGYIPEMTRIVPQKNPDIDVLFYGCINDRRQQVLDDLSAAGVKVEALFGIYGQERDAYIARSKIVLNMHFYEAKVFEIVRVSYLLANRAFVISEQGSNPEEEAYFADGVVFTPYENLVQSCLDYLTQDAERQAIAQRGFEKIQQCSAVVYLQQGLEALPHLKPVQDPSGLFIRDFYRKYLAKRAFYIGEYQQSIVFYEETLQVDPLCLESYWTLGLVLRCVGDDLTADMVWATALEGTDLEDLEESGTDPDPHINSETETDIDHPDPDRLAHLVDFLQREYQQQVERQLTLQSLNSQPQTQQELEVSHTILRTIDASLKAIEAWR